jgi:predicted DNA-binding protein (MmcQ/YjbR family)
MAKTKESILKKLREVCLAWPETREVLTFGNPAFQAGKRTFAVLDEYRGESCIAFKVPLPLQQLLLEDPRFFQSPYGASQGWTCLKVSRHFEWKEVRSLLLESYRLVALKRMLKAASSL